MTAGRHLTLVTERDESLQAFEAFKRAFAAGADLFENHVVAFPSGSFRVDVYWHRWAEIWGGFRGPVYGLPPSEEPFDIFGNTFGVEDPNQQPRLNMTVEINPPHEEIRRTAGVFLRDESERLYVGHTGRLGGRGFKQAEFRKFAQAQGFEWQEIAMPRGRLRQVVVFGPFQDPALLRKELARYIHTVARFKGGIATRR